MALTERQQEIVDLQKEGKKPAEIAEQLGITTNAVYQNIRRARDQKSARKSGGSTSNATAETTATTKSAVAEALPTATPRPPTPLQSLRARRDEISADLKEAESERDTAAKIATRAQDNLDKLTNRYAEELKRLDAAEHALKGSVPNTTSVTGTATAPPAPPKSNGSASKPSGRKTAAQAAKEKADAEAKATPEPPTSQADREATADFDTVKSA